MDPNDESVVYRTSKDENEEKNCRSLLLKETPIEFRPTLEQAGVSGPRTISDDLYRVILPLKLSMIPSERFAISMLAPIRLFPTQKDYFHFTMLKLLKFSQL